MKSRERNNLMLKTLMEIRDGINILVAMGNTGKSNGQEQLLLESLHNSTEDLAQVVKDHTS